MSKTKWLFELHVQQHREIIAVCTKNYTKPVNTKRGVKGTDCSNGCHV